jgi:uncharacterized membrane protein
VGGVRAGAGPAKGAKDVVDCLRPAEWLRGLFVSTEGGERRLWAASLAWLAAMGTILALDLAFLGGVARGAYEAWLGPLRRPAVYWPAALAFYAMYATAIVVHAVLRAASAGDALRRGAGLGLVAYATYELTNWAVLRDWPAALVPLDIGWGVVLTAAAALAGSAVHRRMVRRP